ncbi:MAG: ATP-dependent Clp protease proteolytic subunit [Parcubacteria group bacterium]|nr:ATP-dependent Clp protease proteolytic subunit [Parcubacteria group bacterium]MBI3074988.1 ATP-dependent Clp protease proteolytic subunit [Parcubacteria group bacterium]
MSTPPLSEQNMREKLLARGIIPIVGKIDDDTLKNTAGAIERLRGTDTQTRITLFFHTSGGDCQPALWLMDFIRMTKTEVTGIVCGKYNSIGIALLQACATRYATPFSEFFPHMMSGTFRYSAFEKNAKKNFAREYERTTNLQKRVMELVAERSRKSMEDVMELYRRGEERGDYRLTATDALAFGLIDGIIDGAPYNYFADDESSAP